MAATTLASGTFPALSPIPFMVRCRPLTPALDAANALDTERS